ncbi:MAG: amidohydrolase family protein [Acidobacteria bacterium]|nr:amidohydrolase family protein [Acidobacteriota bacterium]
MTSRLVVVAAAFCYSCGQPAPPAEQAPSAVTVFSAAEIIVGDSRPPLRGGALVVENGTITRVDTLEALDVPASANRVDFGDATIMPLMINLHGHPGFLQGTVLSAANYSRAAILEHLALYEYYGVGAVLALGTDVGETARAIREEQRAGRLGGARLLTAGRGLTAIGGWPTVIPALKDAPIQVATADEARAAVRQLAEADVDVIKIWVDDNLGRIPKLPRAVYAAAIAEAHEHGKPVYAHVFSLDDAKAVVAEGADVLAHSIRDRAVDAALIQSMRERNVAYVPTLTAHEATFIFADRPDWINDPALRQGYPQLPMALGAPEFAAGIAKNPDLALFRQQYAIARQNLKALADGGIRIAMGTDSGTANRFYGYNEQRELELMVSAGLTPAQAITAATQTAAALIGLDDIGTLTEGRRGDFAVVTGRPAENILDSRRIEAVFRSGKAVSRDALRVQK